jgi:hypothetical protein
MRRSTFASSSKACARLMRSGRRSVCEDVELWSLLGSFRALDQKQKRDAESSRKNHGVLRERAGEPAPTRFARVARRPNCRPSTRGAANFEMTGKSLDLLPVDQDANARLDLDPPAAVG